MRRGWAVAAAAVSVVAMAGASPSGALEPDFGVTADGRPYLTGGIGLEERQALARSKPDFSLRVTTAARGSGAFLSGVRIRILGTGDRSLLECELSGPILLVDLLPGQYEVEAATAGQVLRRRTTVVSGGAREIYFYFDVAAEVLPKSAPQAR